MQDPWGRELRAEEVTTVRRLAEMTGRPAGEIVLLVNHNRLEQARFEIVVSLATETLTLPPGETMPPDWQDQGVAQYAAHLMDFEP